MAQIRMLGTALSGSTTATDDREQHQGAGSPEGVVTGDIGDIYRDITPSAAVIYVKTVGNNSNTGWEPTATEVPASLTTIEDGDSSVVTEDGTGVTVDGPAVLITSTDGDVTVDASANDGNINVDAGAGQINLTADTLRVYSTVLGFYSANGVAQHASIANATTAVDIIPLFNTLLDALRDLGLIADLP